VKAAGFAMSNGGRAALLSVWMTGTDAFNRLARKYAASAGAYAYMRKDVTWQDFVPIADAIKAYEGMREACSSGD
jgi:hypothetical protein